MRLGIYYYTYPGGPFPEVTTGSRIYLYIDLIRPHVLSSAALGPPTHMTQMSADAYPARPDTNAILLPSGDQYGRMSIAGSSVT